VHGINDPMSHRRKNDIPSCAEVLEQGKKDSIIRNLSAITTAMTNIVAATEPLVR
jgi:hypothetical protein